MCTVQCFKLRSHGTNLTELLRQSCRDELESGIVTVIFAFHSKLNLKYCNFPSFVENRNIRKFRIAADTIPPSERLVYNANFSLSVGHNVGLQEALLSQTDRATRCVSQNLTKPTTA